MPKVSVVIPTYNRAKYISEAIDSVLAQTYTDFEIIVVDDGSTDNTKDVLARYNGKIKYFYQRNSGSAAARNLGINAASGEYIAFLDSDDIWMKDTLEQEANFLKAGNLDFVYAKMVVKDVAGIVLGYKPSRYQESSFDWFIKNIGHMPTSTILVRKECFAKAGYFDESLRVMQDYDLWIRIARHYKIGYLDKILAVYRKHTTNVTNSEHLYNQARIRIGKKILLDKEIANQYKFFIAKRMAKDHYLLGKYYYLNRSYKPALDQIGRAIRVNFALGASFWDKNDSLLTKTCKLSKPFIFWIILFFMAFSGKNTEGADN